MTKQIKKPEYKEERKDEIEARKEMRI